MNVVEIGRKNQLTVVSKASNGLYLEGGEFGNILLPATEAPEVEVGTMLPVFIYLDSDDFVIATTAEPKGMVGEFVALQVAEVNRIGAFLEWGLPKQLLLPYAEQRKPLNVGDRVVVRIYLDNSERLAASTKLDKFLQLPPRTLAPAKPVNLLVVRRNDLGYSVIVDNSYWALLHQQDLFRPVRIGQRLAGFIKRILPDGKVDVALQPPGYAKVDPLAQRILDYLADHQGFCPLADKSAPEAIYQQFAVSKKAYKMAIGQLRKQGVIEIAEDGIHQITGT